MYMGPDRLIHIPEIKFEVYAKIIGRLLLNNHGPFAFACEQALEHQFSEEHFVCDRSPNEK